MRYRTVGLGTDIQQIVAAAACAGDEIVDDGLRRLPIIVGFVVSPTVIEGHTGFPCASLVSRADLLLGRRKISRQSVAVVNNNVRLKLENHVVHLLRLPLLGRQGPVNVVPQDVDLPVVGHEFTNQPVGIGDESLPRRFIGCAARSIRMVPVHQRIVEADPQSF